MKIKTSLRTSLFVIFASTLLLSMPSAQAETVNCKLIGTLPATISVPGIYCLFEDRKVNIGSGNAITINSNDVVLDLNAHTVENSSIASWNPRATGISAIGKNNITIKNGTVRGFHTGINVSNYASGIGTFGLIEDMHIIATNGLLVSGDNVVVRNNRIAGHSVGILVTSNSSRIVISNNDIHTGGTGIYFSSPSLSIIKDGVAINNRVMGARTGIAYTNTSYGLYRDNIALASTPYVRGGAIDGGNNK